MLFFLASGDTFIILFALCFVVALPIILIGVVVFVLRRNNKNRAVWQQVSRETGLTMPNPKKLELKGVYDNCDVRIAIGMRRTGGGDSRHNEYFTYSTSSFPHSLRLLLNIETNSGFLSKVFSSKGMKIGNDNFDETFRASCYDPNVLRTLLTSDFHSSKTQNVMGDLMLAKNSFGKIKIDDNGIYIEEHGQIGDPELLKNMIATTSFLSRRFQNGRKKLPRTNWETSLLNSWHLLASSNNLSLDADNYSISGSFQGFPVAVSVKTAEGKWQTEVVLKFPQSLMIGLKIMPENSIHRALTWLGVQDIESGIKEFDDAFIVKAKDIAAAKRKLQPDFCQQLFGLCKNTSKFIIDDEQIAFTVDEILGDGKILKSYLGASALAAQMLLCSV